MSKCSIHPLQISQYIKKSPHNLFCPGTVIIRLFCRSRFMTVCYCTIHENEKWEHSLDLLRLQLPEFPGQQSRWSCYMGILRDAILTHSETTGWGKTELWDCEQSSACLLFHFLFSTLRSRKELRDKGPPRVLQNLKDVMLIEGSAAKLECRISAFPDPFIRWSKDGVELKDGPKYRYVFEDPDIVALVVRDAALPDLGKYSIAVKNPFGECSDSARLLIEGNVTLFPHSLLNIELCIPWAMKTF